MKNNSIWTNNTIQRRNNNTNTNLQNKTDILIIGGGITGLSCAYFLKNSSSSITLIDKSRLGMGTTSKTTAKITYLQGIIYQTLLKKFNIKIAKLYYDSQTEAIKDILEIVQKNKIDCDLEQTPSIIFTNKWHLIKKILTERKILESFKAKTEIFKDKNIKYGIKVNDTYCFNPIKYLEGLINSIKYRVNIYENTTATNIRKIHNYYEVKTTKGIIHAKKVIIACHYPFFIIPTLIPLKTYIKREYVNASQIDSEKQYSAINIDNELYSVRYYKNYLIYGSNKHRLTNKTDYFKNYEKSKKDYYKYFNKTPEYTWMNQDIMSNDSLPMIGEIKDNLYISTAYNAWGMTNGTIGAKIISDLILNKANKYKTIFNPNRVNINLIVSSTLGTIHYIKAYISSVFIKNNPSYIRIKKTLYGVYKDEFNIKHYIKIVCPHMKCELVFNKEEKTWDCPCHGSRFDLDGNIIEGPATKKLKKTQQ